MENFKKLTSTGEIWITALSYIFLLSESDVSEHFHIIFTPATFLLVFISLDSQPLTHMEAI